MTLDESMRTVATILAISVLIDKRQRDQEMVEFVHSLTTINHAFRPGTILPRPTILAWFEKSKADIAANLAGSNATKFQRKLLNAISDPEMQKMLLASIFAISICDYEFRDEECEFVKLALEVWNTGLPRIEDMDLVAG